jgi:lipopolysaccharide/colanic/teichoic acid biosynthesis glycosyltransferase
MKKRGIYYLLHYIIVIVIIYLSFLIYFRDIDRAVQVIFERKGNVILIFLLTVFLCSLFDLISYKKNVNREVTTFREVFSVLGNVFAIILVVSFVEFFLFFRTKIGRVIYVSLYFQLTLYFIIETIVRRHSEGLGTQKVLWLSRIPFGEIEKEYLSGYRIRAIHGVENGNEREGNNEYSFAIYDYPPRDGASIKSLLQTVISIKKPIDLVTYIEETTERVPLRYIDELWLLSNIRTHETVYDKVRRIINFFSSFVLLIVLFPISYLFAMMNRIGSKGGLFFIQKRVGYRGKEFRLIKFRTMIHDAERDGPRFVSDNDPRITKIGRVMRKLRLDEVPQLLNVLKGDMNLIGPRPERSEFIETLEKDIPYYKLRLQMRPGLTGWAQVNYQYAGKDVEQHLKKLEYDLYYIKNRRLSLDVLILLKTIKTVLTSRGK